jgi:hypothetical protein
MQIGYKPNNFLSSGSYVETKLTLARVLHNQPTVANTKCIINGKKNKNKLKIVLITIGNTQYPSTQTFYIIELFHKSTLFLLNTWYLWLLS